METSGNAGLIETVKLIYEFTSNVVKMDDPLGEGVTIENSGKYGIREGERIGLLLIIREPPEPNSSLTIYETLQRFREYKALLTAYINQQEGTPDAYIAGKLYIISKQLKYLQTADYISNKPGKELDESSYNEIVLIARASAYREFVEEVGKDRKFQGIYNNTPLESVIATYNNLIDKPDFETRWREFIRKYFFTETEKITPIPIIKAIRNKPGQSTASRRGRKYPPRWAAPV